MITVATRVGILKAIECPYESESQSAFPHTRGTVQKQRVRHPVELGGEVLEEMFGDFMTHYSAERCHL